MLLDNASPKFVLEKLLDSRRTEIMTTLSSFQPSSNVSDYLRKTIIFIVMTIKQSSNIFLSRQEKPSPLDQYMNLLQNKNTSGSIDSRPITDLYTERTNIHVIFQYLPTSIQNYTPLFYNNDKNPLTQEAILSTITKWVADIVKETTSPISKIMDFVISGKEMFRIRSDILNEIHILDSSAKIDAQVSSDPIVIFAHFSWNEIKEMSLLPLDFDLWSDFLKSPILRRSLKIIKTAFEKLAAQPDQILKPELDKLGNECIFN